MKNQTSLKRTLCLCSIVGCVSGGLIGAYELTHSKFDSPSAVMAVAGELAKVVARLISEQFEAALFFIVPIAFLVYVMCGTVGGLLFGFVWHRLRRSIPPGV